MAVFGIVVLFAIFVSPVFTSNVSTSNSYYNSQCKRCKQLSNSGGNIPPTYCAFYKNGSLNTDIIPTYVDYLIKRVKIVIVNHPSFGCDRLSLKERKKNLYYWSKAAKPRGLIIIAYTSGCSLPDVIDQSIYARRQGVAAVMIGPDNYNRYRTTSLRVEYAKQIADKVYPTPLIYDFEAKLREGGTANVAKFHKNATRAIINYWGVRANAIDCMSVVTETNLTQCQVVMNYDSLIFAPTGTKFISPAASYASSIYIKDVVDIFVSISEQKPSGEPISLLLKVDKKFGVAVSYLNLDNYDRSSFPYIEPVLREVFICITNIDVGRSRQLAVYKTFSNLRGDLRRRLNASGQFCKGN